MAKKKESFTRANISLSCDLKERMDAVKIGVNWSAVAAEAFEKKLLELRSVWDADDAKDFDDYLIRLRAAKELENKAEYQDGLNSGETWARTKASPKQLQRIARYIKASEELYTGYWYDINNPRWVAAEFGATDHFVVHAAWPDRRNDSSAPADFWKRALGDASDRVQDADFFHGFGDGVVEFWKQVADRL